MGSFRCPEELWQRAIEEVTVSEFECSRGHLMRPSDGPFCNVILMNGEVCGARVAYMDGKNSKQLSYEDEQYDRDREEDEDESDNSELD